jgi:hypothetical protein
MENEYGAPVVPGLEEPAMERQPVRRLEKNVFRQK